MAAPIDGDIAVYATSDDAFLGYVSDALTGFYTYPITTDVAEALTVEINTPIDAPFSLLALNAPNSSYPYIGAVSGAAGVNFTPGSPSYAFLSELGTNTGVTSDDALSSSGESAIWSFGFDNALTAEWTNSDGSTSPLTLFHDITYGDLDMAGDTAAFVTAYGDSIQPVYFVFDAVCYGAGTRILTVRGEVAVEHLAVGDLVVTASGERRAIRWLGSRTLNCGAHPDPRSVWPVRIAAHAFGDNQPSRDLFVSPAHALQVSVDEDILIPACRLINGSTIARHPVDEVAYWHVELDSHDVLLAEGLPAESYLESGNRRFFAQADAAGVPEPRDRPANGFCLPFIEAGATLAFVREALEARARRLGWTPRDDVAAALIVDCDTLASSRLGSTLVFRFPSTASQIRLRSDSFVPDDLNGHDDRRRLGLNIHWLSLQGEGGEARRIALDDPRLGEGFHAVERDGDRLWRWTDGAASLPRALWRDLKGVVTLRISCDGGVGRGWKAPPGSSVAKAARPALRLVG